MAGYYIRSLTEDKSIVIQVVLDRLDYLSEAEKQFDDKNIYNDISFNDKILRDTVETSNKMVSKP